MQIAIVIGCLLAIVWAAPSSKNQDDEWKQFKIKFGKEYSSYEDSLRRSIYFRNKKTVLAHNNNFKRGLASFSVGINQFSDLTHAEMVRKMYRYKSGTISKATEIYQGLNETLPKSVDWRKRGAVTEVKDQQFCGASWAFSAVGALEGHLKIKTKTLVTLSEQNLVDCLSPEKKNGCSWGSIAHAFKYIHDNGGIDIAETYPYIARKGKCHFKKKNVGGTAADYVKIAPGDEIALQHAVAKLGPVSVAIDASHESFTSYTGGIYDEPACSSKNRSQAVLVVGYGVYKKHEYWLIKNSFGLSWGINGYMMMARNKNNTCGIASEALYPVMY